MKRWLLLVMVLFMVLMPIQRAKGEDAPEDENWDAVFMQVLSGLDFSKMEEALNNMGDETKALLGGSVRQGVALAGKGELRLDAWQIIQTIYSLTMESIRENGGMLLRILLLSAISALVGVLKPSLHAKGAAEAASMVSYLIILTMLCQVLYSAVSTARDAVSSMSGVISAVFPVMLVLLTAMGGSMSGAVFSPAMAVLTSGIGVFIQTTVLPMVLTSGVLVLISSISERVQISKMAAFIKKIAVWTISVIFVVFLAVTTWQGLSGAAMDGFTLRTTKFAIDKFVPIIGGMFSDTVDTLLGCSLVIKNGIGIVGTVLMAVSILTPVLSIASLGLMLSFAAAIVEPFGEKRIHKCLGDVSGVMTLLYVTILALGAMMFILLTLTVASGNINMMLR